MKLPQRFVMNVRDLAPERQPRRGFTLIELTAGITLSALLMGIAVTVLIKFDRQDKHIGLRQRQSSDLARLADHFRADIHVATRVTVPDKNAPAGTIFDIRLPDGTSVEYRQTKQHLLRVASDAEGKKRQERFLLTPDTTFAIERVTPEVIEGAPPEPEETERGQLVKLIARWPMNGTKYDAFRQLPITARIGRDLPVRLVNLEVNDAAP